MKMKKVIAVLCLVCLVFSFSTVAFAAEESMSRKTVEFSEVESAKMTYNRTAVLKARNIYYMSVTKSIFLRDI